MSEQETTDLQTPFERTLLLSARSDAPPPEATEQAWLRFSGMVGAAALSAGSVHAGAVVASGGWAHLWRVGVLKYFLVGALSGSALTVAWFQAHPKQVFEAPPAEVRVVDRGSSTLATPVVTAPVSTEGPVTPPTALIPEHAPSAPAIRRGHEKPSLGAATAARNNEPEPAAPSSLSAETSALDAARKASAAGAFHHALSLLAQYEQDFPHGVLRADAEVTTVQVLDAAGDHAQAVRRATQFLAEYPNDPHSMTLKRFLSR